MLAAIQTYGAAAAATPAAVFPDTSEVRRGERRSFPASGNESGQGVSGAFGGIRRGLAPGGLCPAPGCRGPSEGWRGRLKLSFGVSAGERGGRTVLDRTERSGPLAVQRLFYPEGPAPDGVVPCEAYVLHPPGGLVTGDALEVDAECGPGAKALLTTPAASKFYRAKERPGLQSQSFAGAAAGPGAELEHLPQEAIVFSGARALQETVYRVSGGGALAGWGTVLLGRAAAGESGERGSYEETLAV
ncbi:MAG: urease accessory protein UreD, partial [Deltaproteobacteria bacterium]|nr:urease accessory protein UreD [Deltaproteobacteria bacterium]